MKLNVRLITIHLFATILIAAGVRQFVALFDLNLVETISKFEYKDWMNHITPREDISLGERINSYFRLTFYFAVLAIFISFIISLIISFNKKIFWLNSVIVFIIAFFIQKELFKLYFVTQITHYIGGLFIDLGFGYACIIDGLFWTALGLFLFFNKWSNKSISGTSNNS